ncbi:TVP38/TMEM64 family protein [Fictibacillus enclensis]|uniref:TVP38/TMEM64 family protein n=1 Tax=Fictibacillus enclensis TaxID=1017270 RepID=UPI0025A25735|nr:TVP38/TMEM64 family protein [Fictibacillus enclensis]MDM5199611.1 TVP38/TMEM64 family protein [Fictibacillus enclensis]
MIRSKRNWMKILIIAISVALLWYFNHKYLNLTPEVFREWILSWGVWAPIVFIVLYGLRPFVLFPSSVFAITSGLAFGLYYGCMYTYIGSLSGGLMTYLAVRWIGKRAMKKEWKGKYQKVQEGIKEKGFIYVLILRLLPILNYDLVSYLTAAANVRFRDYAAATAIGIIPGTLAYTYIGSSVAHTGMKEILISSIILIILIVLPVVTRKRWQKKLGL